MKERFLALVNLKPEEMRLAFSLWVLIAINTFVLELADVVATAGFVSNLGVDRIPWLWIVTTLITIFAAGFYLVFIDRYPRLHLVIWLLIAFTYGLAPLWAAAFGIGSIIFIAIQLVAPVTPFYIPVFFYVMFFVSLVASFTQYGQRREITTEPPPPEKEA